jgi:hypothetical protein
MNFPKESFYYLPLVNFYHCVNEQLPNFLFALLLRRHRRKSRFSDKKFELVRDKLLAKELCNLRKLSSRRLPKSKMFCCSHEDYISRLRNGTLTARKFANSVFLGQKSLVGVRFWRLREQLMRAKCFGKRRRVKSGGRNASRFSRPRRRFCVLNDVAVAIRSFAA